MEFVKYQLVLGSQSPRRKELLSWLNIPFIIKTADLDEISLEEDPKEVAMDLALQKGRAVREAVNTTNAFIVSSDTIVVLGNTIYNKPKDRADARRILLELAGKTHQVITGVCFQFIDQQGKRREHRFYDETLVTFDEIDEVTLENYLDTNDSLDKAGAYGIQGPSLTFIANVNGSYSNVVGFPLNRVKEEMSILLGNEFRSLFL